MQFNKRELDPHEYVAVTNGYPGQLIYRSRKTGEETKWEEYAKLDDEIKEVVTSMRIESRESAGSLESVVTWQNNMSTQIDNKIKSITTFLNSNTKIAGTSYSAMLQDAINRLELLKSTILGCDNITKKFKEDAKASLSSVSSQVSSATQEIISAGKTGNTMWTRFKNGIEKFGGWTIVTRALTAVD